MQAMYWIYKRGNQRGPFTFAKIESMWHSGMLNDGDLIRRGDQPDWYAIRKMARHLRWVRAPTGANIFDTTVVIARALVVAWICVMVWWMYN
jgi:hypothetical protein